MFVELALIAGGLYVLSKQGESPSQYPEPDEGSVYDRIYQAAEKASNETGIPQSWILATIDLEDASYDPEIVGDQGRSFGLMQVQEASYQTLINAGYGTVPNWKKGIEENIKVGSRYMKWIMDSYGVTDPGILREMYTLGPSKYLSGKRNPVQASKFVSGIQDWES